jgi:hypothetical protein
MSKSHMTGYGRSTFSFLRNLHTDFRSGWTNIPTNNVWGSLPIPHPHQHLLLFVFLMITILTGWGGSSVILICISFIAKDLEHFFMYLFAICTSFDNSLFNSFAHLLIGLFVLQCLSLYIFWVLILCLLNHLQTLFSHSECWLFILVIASNAIPFVNSCSYFLSNWNLFQNMSIFKSFPYVFL